MTAPYFDAGDVVIHHGKALDVLPTLAAASVNCIVTSPPYYGLRDYEVEGQIGLEDSPAEYVEGLRATFAEAWRVLTGDGVLWLNLGDSYYSGRGNPGPNGLDKKNPARRGWVRPLDRPGQPWGRPKSLLQIPERVAIALADDGWTLRNKVIWRKANPMPDSAPDRLTCTWEFLYLFSKSRTYYFDLDPIREARAEATLDRYRYAYQIDGNSASKTNHLSTGGMIEKANPLGKNPGDVWVIPTQPFPGAHFATFPPEIPRRCILASCPAGGTVLDLFHGAGTTGMMARRLGRQYIGVELKAEYIDMSIERIGPPTLDFLADVTG